MPKFKKQIIVYEQFLNIPNIVEFQSYSNGGNCLLTCHFKAIILKRTFKIPRYTIL